MEKYTYRQTIFEMFYYIMRNEKIDFFGYKNDYELNRKNHPAAKKAKTDGHIFKYRMKECIKIFDDLKIEYDCINTEKNENIFFDFSFPNVGFNFDYSHLSIDERRNYKYEITFLILLKNCPFDFQRSKEIFGDDFKNESFWQLINGLRMCIAGEIIKSDKTKSYKLIGEFE